MENNDTLEVIQRIPLDKLRPDPDHAPASGGVFYRCSASGALRMVISAAPRVSFSCRRVLLVRYVLP